MRRMQTLLLLVSALAFVAGELVNTPTVRLSTERQRNYSSPGTPAQEGTKIESWSPSQPPEPTQMLSYQRMPNPQPFLPANYYHLPGEHFAPPAKEYRNEHYSAYLNPFESSYAYPAAQPLPTIDLSLIPTSKHFVIVSFIGLLLLFAIIQNSLTYTKRKDTVVEVLANRSKRNIIPSADFTPLTAEVESALKEVGDVGCMQRLLCNQNRKLLEDFGFIGKFFANYPIRRSVKELFPDWDQFVDDTAKAGLRVKNCEEFYRNCSSKNLAELPAEDKGSRAYFTATTKL